MKDLLNTMSSNMDIARYRGESNDSYVYRLFYSALGQWCLRLAQNNSDGRCGTSKHNQTIVLNELIHRYNELFPGPARCFLKNNDTSAFPVHIRRLYEETGYLLTDEANWNSLANFGRRIRIGKQSLYFGIPKRPYTTIGLGVFSEVPEDTYSLSDFLIRDTLSPEEYFRANYDIVDFSDKEIDINELEFFDPLLPKVPSSSWSQSLVTDCSIARKKDLGAYYRIMKCGKDELLFADDRNDLSDDSFTAYEYRRLYFALKAHYGNSLKAQIDELDKNYSKVKVFGHLPNREYHLMLLLSWPMDNAFNKGLFLTRKECAQTIKGVLEKIGIKVEEKGINE